MAPEDPILTVRAGDGMLAVRAHSAQADCSEDDLSWFVIVGDDDVDLVDPEQIEAAIGTWPIVYQP